MKSERSSANTPRGRLPAERFVAVIGDLEGSRKLPDGQRQQAQRDLERLMNRLNTVPFPPAARWTITTGDEFQGLLDDVSALPEILWQVATSMRSDVRLRLGVGYGRLVTSPLRRDAIGMDGPVFHDARQAIDAAKSDHAGATTFRGFGSPADDVLSGLGRALHDTVHAMTARQRQIIDGVREGKTQAAVARNLGISRAAVSKQVAAGRWNSLRQLEASLLAALHWAIHGPVSNPFAPDGAH